MATTYEYAVRLPIVGFIDVTVESDVELSDEDAYYAALDTEAAINPGRFADNWEFELPEKIVQGNVFYGPCNEVSVELVDTVEDDD